MVNRFFESGGQRVDPNGRIEEIAIKGKMRDTLLEQATKDYFQNDTSGMWPEKSDLSLKQEKYFDLGLWKDAVSAKYFLEEMRERALKDPTLSQMGDLNEISVRYHDKDFFLWNNGEAKEPIPLTKQLLEKIDSGAISHATFHMGTNVINIENGKVVDIWDGWEDKIPQAVMDDAAEFAKGKNTAVTVVPFGASSAPTQLQYMYVNDGGEILTLASRIGAVGPVKRVDPNKPTYNSSGANGVGQTVGDNSDAPHVDNPVEVKNNAQNLKNGEDKPTLEGYPAKPPLGNEGKKVNYDDKIKQGNEPFQLSYEPDLGKIQHLKSTEMLQAKMLHLASLDPNLKIDLGNYGTKHDGIDGKYGPKTQAATMVVEQYLGHKYITGVADHNLMAEIDRKISELQLTVDKKQAVDRPDNTAGAKQKTAPEDTSSVGVNTIPHSSGPRTFTT